MRRSFETIGGVASETIYDWPPKYPESKKRDVVSHICFTSGTSGSPKGCTSSLPSLLSYLHAKNIAHDIYPVQKGDGTNGDGSVVFLASSVSFDPCFSDILATFSCCGCTSSSKDGDTPVGATLALAPRTHLFNSIASCLHQTRTTHVLCTPTLWSTVSVGPADLRSLKVVALGGESIPRRIVKKWARRREN